jgi:NADPH:quinone reductase-like Zn-dependent oxidoreductase
VIEEVGAGVTGLSKGQAVYGTSNGGAYAEYVVVAANNVAPKPPSLTFVQAAGVPVGALTAWSAVIDTANVEAGQQVFVQGGAGGVGSYAVQLARWKGAHVTATASERNLEFVRGLGAETVIDYGATAFESIVHDMDVVIDTVGGGVRERSWRVLRPGGFLVTIVGLPSQEAAQAHGVRAAAVVRRDPARTHEMLKQIADLIEAGQIKVEITHTFPLAQAAQAQERGQRGHGRGRIVLLTA